MRAAVKTRKIREAAKIGRDVLSMAVEALGRNHPFTLSAMSSVALFDYFNDILPISSLETKIHEVLSLRRLNLGEDHPQTLSSLKSVACIESMKGNQTVAINIYELLSKTLQRIYKTEKHPALVRCYLDHAVVLSYHRDYCEAARLQRKAYNLAVSLSNENDPRISEISCQLIQSLSCQHRYAEAENIASSAIWKLQGVLNKNHPRVLALLKARAFLRVMEGRYLEAETLRTQALNAILPYGDDHPHVIFARDNLASALYWQDRFVEAENLYQKVIDFVKLVSGNKNAEIVGVMRDIAHLRIGQGRLDEGVALRKEILEMTISIHGNIQTVVGDMLDLASAHRWVGHLEDSECLVVTAIERSKKVFGANHPLTLESMSRMADLKEDQKNWTEALQLRNEVFDMCSTTFGPHYFLTLQYHRYLANTLANVGDYDTSQKYLNDIFKETSSIFGIFHRDTVRCLRDLAWVHQKRSDLPGAATLLRQAYEISSTMLGDEHPDTVSVREHLDKVLGLLQRGGEREVVLR